MKLPIYKFFLVTLFVSSTFAQTSNPVIDFIDRKAFNVEKFSFLIPKPAAKNVKQHSAEKNLNTDVYLLAYNASEFGKGPEIHRNAAQTRAGLFCKSQGYKNVYNYSLSVYGNVSPEVSIEVVELLSELGDQPKLTKVATYQNAPLIWRPAVFASIECTNDQL